MDTVAEIEILLGDLLGLEDLPPTREAAERNGELEAPEHGVIEPDGESLQRAAHDVGREQREGVRRVRDGQAGSRAPGDLGVRLPIFRPLGDDVEVPLLLAQSKGRRSGGHTCRRAMHLVVGLEEPGEILAGKRQNAHLVAFV